MKKKSSSILKKFLIFNFTFFTILGLFTIFYLKAIQPSLVKDRTKNHILVIKNTSDHLNRLDISLEEKNIKTFLLSTRFLFQNLDRVRFYNSEGQIIGDTNILDLDQNVFTRVDTVILESIDEKNSAPKKKINEGLDTNNTLPEESIKKMILGEFQGEPIVIEKKVNDDFFVSTLNKVNIKDNTHGFIMVTEQANDILIAVEERKNFILRTVFAVTLLIIIFSLFLNKYILIPIRSLVLFTEAIKLKADKNINMKKYFVREDEIGKLTHSIDEMTKELQKRTARAETFSTDLAHEIRNPLASLKGASELLDKNEHGNEREKLLKIVSHDVERIERLITDYSQMLKDEASLSREKMKLVNVYSMIEEVVEEFKQNLSSQNKKIEINILSKNKNHKKLFVFGIHNRLEQVVANLLDNAISFSKNNSKIEIEIKDNKENCIFIIKDQGPGFGEGSTQKIFKRFYSNRPTKFGKHSGLGLNIVKNIVELHKGDVKASNRTNKNGAQIEVHLPKSS